MVLFFAAGLFVETALCLDIQFNYLDGFEQRTEAATGLEAAATIWESVLADPVDVTIDVVALPVIELGFTEAITYHSSHVPTYAEVRRALVNDARSADDFLAVSRLPAGPSLTYRTSDPFGNIIISSGDDAINGYLDVPRANAKALGFSAAVEPGVSDAEIQLNEFFLTADWYDFDRSDGIDGTDFVGAMLHEIGHALGFKSGVNVIDYYTLPAGPDAPEGLNEFAIWNVLDLFRYSNASLPQLDLALGGEPYFSIDGGATSLARLATGQFNGDGDQAGHWTDSTGLMDPFATPDALLHIRSIDLRAMDVIGWDVRTLSGDFSFDGALDTFDIDLLVSEIVRKSEDTGFDISADGLVDRDDLARWLVTAAAHNGFAEAYASGDANLDGHVDAHDLNQLGIHWLQNLARWSAGDFTADGVVDVGDLNKLALNWQQQGIAVTAISEPSSMTMLALGLLVVTARRRWAT